MLKSRTFLLFIFLAAPFFQASAATTGDWTNFSDSLAFGNLDGVNIAAFSMGSAPFIGLAERRFAEGSGWDADMALPRNAESLITSNVNGGDAQEFRFASPIRDAMLYIENFDADSVANITASGADTLDLVSGSQSISFASINGSSGTLMSSNSSYNGEGDAVLHFTGDVTRILVDYVAGEGANGVFYGFAVESVQAVPEPSSAVLLTSTLAMAPLALRRRRD